jgi:putative peptide zinc metalloprotease protein
MPIPYVDASAASTFRDTKKRVVVGAAGMIVEVFIAALAMFVWMFVDTGLLHVIAYNTMLIAGVSTILFNANPLLRFDGYYILSDLIEIPNLGSRANNYLGYLIQRYLFGVRSIDKSEASWGEKAWFVFYSIASFCYRMFVVSIIVLFISAKFFVIGVLLAIWSLTMMLIVPTFKSISKIFTSPQIRPKRKRAILSTSGVVAMVIGGLLLVPINSWTRTEGVVWVEGDAVVRAGTDCFIAKLITSPGEFVTRDTPLFECRNAELITQAKVIQAGLAELQALYDQQIEEERVKAEITKEEIKNLRADLERTEEEINSLVIKSHVNGTFVVPNATDIIGKFVRKGESIGYTLNPVNVTVKAVVDQEDIDLVRLHTQSVEIRRADDFDTVLKTKISRQVPAATDQLPSAALTTEGGGKVAIDPSSKESIKAFEKVFLVDLELPVQSDHYYVGSRVYVKFNHEWQPLADQWFRSLRQLFLGHFDV